MRISKVSRALPIGVAVGTRTASLLSTGGLGVLDRFLPKAMLEAMPTNEIVETESVSANVAITLTLEVPVAHEQATAKILRAMADELDRPK